jgi:RND family efflux transporter MFP subunit
VAIDVDAGHRVKAGETLFRMDDELARLELDQAVAAEAEAEANLADAERRLSEVQSLLERKSFPESEARSIASQVERNRAVLQRRRAERAQAAAIVERHTLEAPFDGVIASRNADPGERVDTDTNVLELVAIDRLQLDLQVPQSYFRRVGNRTTVSVRVDALPGQTFEAAVDRVVPVSDPDARTFLVRTWLDNADTTMTPGMSARAVLRIGTGREGVVVPRDALIRYPDGRTVVWVAQGDGGKRTVEERRVETGLTFDGQVEILEGLSEGEPVVVRGNETLQQGQEVRIAGVN